MTVAALTTVRLSPAPPTASGTTKSLGAGSAMRSSAAPKYWSSGPLKTKNKRLIPCNRDESDFEKASGSANRFRILNADQITLRSVANATHEN